MIARVVALSACLLIGAGVVAKASRTEVVPPRQSFESFPREIGHWRGLDTERFDAETLAVLGVDEYLSRNYIATGEAPVGLYIGYYQSQRQGDTIHSPLNCLPGAGWQPVANDYATVQVTDGALGPRQITVNRYVIEKGLDRQIVMYWYQSHGRVIANEYRSKIFMVWDAMKLNRSDAALVRVVSPIVTGQSEPFSDQQAITFVQALFPHLSRFLPS